MSDVKELLDYEIYPHIHLGEVLADLDPQDKGRHYLLTCPQCGEREAFIYKDGLHIKCNRLNKCAFSQSLWDYVQAKHGFTNQETLKELARLAGYTLPSLDVYSEGRAEAARQRADIMEVALDYFKSQLWSDKGKEGLAYLKGRGYTEDEIRVMELGFYASYDELVAYLLRRDDLDTGEMSKLGFKTKGFGEDYRLVIPYRDPVSRMKGIIVRALGREVDPKYKFNQGAKRDTLINLHAARGQKRLIVVEGFLDALIASHRGMKGVVATGSAALTDEHIKNAMKYGAKTFILAFDNDQAGQDGTERAIDRINATTGRLRAFVAPSFPEGIKDPDQLIREQGIEAFEELTKNAESAAKWKAKKVLSKHDITTDIGNREALDEVTAYEETLVDPLDSKHFKEAVREDLDIPESVLDSLTQDYRERRAKENLKDGYGRLVRKAQRFLEEGELNEARSLLREGARELEARTITTTIDSYDWGDLERDIIQTPEGLRTGYKSLDEIIRIPQEAVTIVAGRPSHGKTTFMLNLLLNMVKTYEDKAVFFFSYEQTRKQIGLWVLNMLAGIELDEAHNLTQLERYIKGGNTGLEKVEGAKKLFSDYANSGRLYLVDQPFHVDHLARVLAHLKERHPVGAVFIDYIQKVKTRAKYQTRQIEIQRISEQILETAKDLSLPIILGAQLGRPSKTAGYSLKNIVRIDNIREAGDIEQDANLMLGLWNEHKAEEEREAEDETEGLVERELVGPTNIVVKVLKNRAGPTGGKATLMFDAATLTIQDK